MSEDMKADLQEVIDEIDGLKELAPVGVYPYLSRAGRVERMCYEFLDRHANYIMRMNGGDE